MIKKPSPEYRAQQPAATTVPSHQTMEEEELAAIEEDVERKRVAKNPFEEKFTSLVVITALESVGGGDLVCLV